MKLLIAAPCLFLILLSMLFQTESRFAPLAPIDASTALVVNMIPPELSDEHGQNSDPSLAVSHGAALIIGAANYPAAAPTKPPLFQSRDYGRNWKILSSVLPTTTIKDQTYCFSGNGTNFYGAITNSTTNTVSVVRGTDFSEDKSLEIISTSPASGGKPFLQAHKSEAGDTVYIGDLFLGSRPDIKAGSAIVRVLTPGQSGFTPIPVEARNVGTGQDSPAVPLALASDDKTIYVAFIRWHSVDSAETGGEVVVVRDDGEAATKSFRSLIDQQDGLAGRLVATNQTFQLTGSLGQQKIGPYLALAVHPQNKQVVYLCWGSYDTQQKLHQLHLKVSMNGGQDWSDASLEQPIPSAINPALAVAEDGSVGFLYQQLVAKPQGEVWETHFRQQDAGSTIWSDPVLAKFPTSVEPKKKDGDPYLAYRLSLIASDGVFYGVFSAPNIPDMQYFPQGVRFQRKYANGKLFSNDGKEVPFSIDPYFFSFSKPRTGPASTPSETPSPSPVLGILKWANNISTGALLIASVFAIAALYWFARRQPKKWESALQEQLKGHAPALINFDGYLTGRFLDSSGNTIDTMSQDSSCVLRVEVTNQKPSEPWHEPIDLTGGLDAPQVEFRIVIDSSQLQVEPALGVITVPVKGRSERDFAVKPKPNKADNSRVFVQLFQRTSLIQVMELQLQIIE